jgi:hypothetical protein
LDSKYNSELNCDVQLRKADDVDTPGSIGLDGDVGLEMDGDDEEEADAEAEDNEEEDEDEDAGKEPRTIAQGEMVNTSAEVVDPMVDNQPILLPE